MCLELQRVLGQTGLIYDFGAFLFLALNQLVFFSGNNGQLRRLFVSEGMVKHSGIRSLLARSSCVVCMVNFELAAG